MECKHDFELESVFYQEMDHLPIAVSGPYTYVLNMDGGKNMRVSVP